MLNSFIKLFKKFFLKEEETTTITNQPPKIEYTIKEFKYNTVFNHLHEEVSYQVRYAIIKHTIYHYKTRYEYENKDCLYIKGYVKEKDVYKVSWNHLGRCGIYGCDKTWFNSKEEAQQRLDDMLTNPNRYVL